MLEKWFKEIIAEDKQFLVEKCWDEEGKKIERFISVSTRIDNLLYSFTTQKVKNDRELDELFQTIDEEICIENFNQMRDTLRN